MWFILLEMRSNREVNKGDKIKRDKMKKEVKIGIFCVLMILCAWAGIRFLSGIDIFSRNVDYYAAYDKVDGMQEAAPVVIRGVKVGTVTEIIFPSASSREVVLRLTVKKQYRLPKDTEAKIVSSLMGSQSVELVIGSSPEMLEKQDTIRSSASPDLIASVTSGVGPVVEKINRLADELTGTLESLHGVLDANAANIEGMVAHLNSIAGNLDQILSAEKSGLQSAVQGISEFSTTLGENSGRLDTLMGNMARFSDQLASADLVKSLDESLAELNKVLAEISAGEGSLGRLVNDPTLYANLTEASENLSALLSDLKEHPSRYVHLSVFGVNEQKQIAKQTKRAAKEEAKRQRDSLRRLE